MTGRWASWLLAAAVLACGAVSLRLGQDRSFDLLNYHYYAGYAFIHGRLNQDVVPGGIQTYQSPLLHSFHYLGIAHLPARVFGWLLGALQGLNLPLVFLLAVKLVPNTAQSRRTVIAVTLALVAATGPAAVSMLGASFGDNLVSIPALLALLVVIGQAESPSSTRGGMALLAAGGLAGMATGLKLTMGLYSVALFAAVVGGLWRRERWGRNAGLFVLGSVMGFGVTNGFWCWQLLQQFGNPVFPYANALFRSEFYKLEDFRDARWMAHSAYDLVRPAVDTALGRHERLLEIGLRDFRLLLVMVATLLNLAVLGLRALPRTRDRLRWQRLDRPEGAFLLFWFTAYLLWAAAFYYYRYLFILELTAPLVAFVLMRRLVPPGLWARVVFVVAVTLALTSHTDSWGRRRWQEKWLTLTVPPLGRQPDSLVLLVGQPISYAIPSFRPDARFTLITLSEFGPAPRLRRRVDELIASHQGPVLLLSTLRYRRSAAAARVAEFGLRLTDHCEIAGQGPFRLRLCEVQSEPFGVSG